jgi:hypothetical protein
MRAFKISEEKFIREHYGEIPLSKIAEHLGRRKSTVMQHIKQMGLELTPEQRAKAKNTFPKGHKPHNAGTKGVMKSNCTSFKPGQLPHNTKEDGAISIRHKRGDNHAYKFIRVAKAKWKLLHRVIWEQAHGAIPAGHIVTFMDCDTMNCELDNLELITMAQNVVRNQNRLKASESLKHRWKVKKAISKHRAEFPHLFD